MKINKKIVGLIVVVISIAWIYNIVIFMESILEKPIFFRQSSYISEEGAIELTYFENTYLNDQIVSLELPELGGYLLTTMAMSEFEDGNISKKKMAIYLSDINLKYNKNITDLMKDDKLIITKIIYTTSSGEREEVNIGEITVTRKFVSYKKYKILEPFYSGSNGTNSGVASATAKDDINIIDIESENMDDIKRLFDVYIGRNRLEDVEFPINVKRNYPIEVSYKVKDGLTIEDFPIEEYRMPLKLKCSDPEGTIDYVTANLEVSIDSIREISNNKLIRNLNKKMEGN